MTSIKERNRKFQRARSMLITILLSLFIVQSATILASCDDDTPGTAAAEYVPEAPNYDDPMMWFIRENDNNGTGADVFYIVSTWISDWTTADGRPCRYADVHNADRRADMDKEISRIAEYMGEGNNFYSPYYRHMSINVWATQIGRAHV